VIDTRGYEAFGTKNVEAGSDPLTYGFAGEPLEGTTQLAYHRARWMPRVGRFLGMDPKGGDAERPVTFHRYIYGAADPTNAVDPSGREFDMVGIDAVVESLSLILAAPYTGWWGHDNTEPLAVNAVDTRFDPHADSWLDGWAGPLAALTRPVTVEITSVADMVSQILGLLGGSRRSMSELNILDHGNPRNFQIGDNRLGQDPYHMDAYGNPADLTARYIPELSQLRGHFTPDGFVHLEACLIGQDDAVLKEFSAIVGVPVWAGTGLDLQALDANWENYTECTASRCLHDLPHP
jgi:RHS repeat-associated protein